MAEQCLFHPAYDLPWAAVLTCVWAPAVSAASDSSGRAGLMASETDRVARLVAQIITRQKTVITDRPENPRR